MNWLKGCQRCKGDLYENGDMYGWYIVCIQCGCYLADAEPLLPKDDWSNRRSDKTPAKAGAVAIGER